MPEKKYKTLDEDFLQTMDEIGLYGLEKYGDKSLAARFGRGDFSRCERTAAGEIAKHSADHFSEYLAGVSHDKFGTKEHQLAAAAFNAMMEFSFYRATLSR